jgi:DNA-binding transcriptional MerR regulator
VGSSSHTIGQLAAHVGVTVRAVRHYHACGLLAEPDRDASGYRQYGAEAVVDLIRIKTLADAGVPLARIGELLEAGPAEFSQAVAGIDQAMQARIRQLQRHRRQVAQLIQGDRLFLPPEVADLLDRLRGLGVSEPTVRLERDGWILVSALSPELVGEWADQKARALEDADFRDLYLAFDQARDWDPADPRLEALAARGVDWVSRHGEPRAGTPDPGASLSVVAGLLRAQLDEASPALRKLSGGAGR